MKLLLENWREYVKQEVESFLPHGTVRDINMIGSSTLSPEEQDRQDMDKHGHIQAERDIDIEVQIADITREEAEEWAFSDEAERLEIENNYDVQLTIVENWRKYLKEEQGYLYHGTSSEFAREMIDNDNYTAVETYWGDLQTAKDYANSYESPTIVKVPLESIRGEIEPNMTIVQQYEADYPDDLEYWNSSAKTALDSLEIFGSVLLPSGVKLQGATIDETPP